MVSTNGTGTISSGRAVRNKFDKDLKYYDNLKQMLANDSLFANKSQNQYQKFSFIE